MNLEGLVKTTIKSFVGALMTIAASVFVGILTDSSGPIRDFVEGNPFAAMLAAASAFLGGVVFGFWLKRGMDGRPTRRQVVSRLVRGVTSLQRNQAAVLAIALEHGEFVANESSLGFCKMLANEGYLVCADVRGGIVDRRAVFSVPNDLAARIAHNNAVMSYLESAKQYTDKSWDYTIRVD